MLFCLARLPVRTSPYLCFVFLLFFFYWTPEKGKRFSNNVLVDSHHGFGLGKM